MFQTTDRVQTNIFSSQSKNSQDFGPLFRADAQKNPQDFGFQTLRSIQETAAQPCRLDLHHSQALCTSGPGQLPQKNGYGILQHGFNHQKFGHPMVLGQNLSKLNGIPRGFHAISRLVLMDAHHSRGSRGF